MTDKPIELMPYTPLWKDYYIKECRVLEKILKSNCLEIHHIGSTAIQSIKACPILDILCVVHTLDGIEAFKYEFEKMGLLLNKENQSPDKLKFIRMAKDKKTYLSHIYIFEKTNTKINDYLDFKYYLNAELAIAKEYEDLKINLIKQFPKNRDLYKKTKDEFITTVLKSIDSLENEKI